MSRLCVVMAVYNEELMLPGALASLDAAGVPMHNVLVFDGAWHSYLPDGRDTGAMGWQSTDETAWVVEKFGAYWLPCPVGGWESQEAKRSAMFEYANRDYTHAFVMDADERVEGAFPRPLPDGHANAMVKCIGPNDLPGIRGEWPHGDYYPDWKPELRLFRLSPELHCKWPGGYWDADGRIRAYADAKGTSALPVLPTLRFTHHGADRSPERIAEKVAYYQREHPERKKRQDAQHLAEQQAERDVDELRELYRYHRREWHRARVEKNAEVEYQHARAQEQILATIDERLNPRSS